MQTLQNVRHITCRCSFITNHPVYFINYYFPLTKYLTSLTYKTAYLTIYFHTYQRTFLNQLWILIYQITKPESRIILAPYICKRQLVCKAIIIFNLPTPRWIRPLISEKDKIGFKVMLYMYAVSIEFTFLRIINCYLLNIENCKNGLHGVVDTLNDVPSSVVVLGKDRF